MKKIFTLCLVLCMSYLSMGATNLKHEFRATWLTTAWGNDWPKTKATSDATRKQQQDELIAIFDRLQAGNMNAVCLQVRGRSDAFYQSSYEPWAAELAGARGKDPGYDPLAFAIEEAHKRGLELHAWVNPFRVTSAGTLDANDLVKKNAGQWIIQYNNGSFTGEIIDPGSPEAREYVLNVLMEIISNYDIDGIVMDDYFYPYGGTTTEDAASKALHKPVNVVDVNQDGDTDDDWRRSNVDVFLKELYDRIQAEKPWVRFGMGTFGIWTTQTKVAQAYGISLPSGISGLDDYDEQACNPVEWVKNGYVDYINPQLYWPTTSTGQNYGKLCQWWAKDVCEHFSDQLTDGKKVHFFSSQSISSNSAVSEIQAEIDVNRNNLSSGSTGSVFFDTDAYLNMDNALMTSRFATHALPPAMDWKSNTALAAPTNLTVSGSTLSWQHATAERFTVYVYPKGTAWSTAKNDPSYLQGVIYGNSMDISGIDTNANDIAVCAYDRYGVEHETAIYGATPGDVTPPASGTITYELNGGVQSEWETPQAMYNELNALWNTFSGTSKTWGDLSTLKADVAKGIPTLAYGMALDFIADENFKEKFEWLVTYMDAKCAEQDKTLPSTNASFLRYNLQAFFIDGVRAGWPVSANYTTCGVSTVEAYQPYWKSAFANPTNPTEEFVLNAPYKEGYTFAGWYTNADFSGEKVTTINAETEGTLYAKWIDDTWVIKYTSTDGNIITPYATDVFGANIVSNIYENGVGTITFDGPVTSIGKYAFSNCSSLTSITIPNSITSIGSHAFNYCSSLTSITIPNSVTSIYGSAFSGCSSLTSMTVENGNTVYDSRENCNAIIETATNTLIAGCQNTIIPNSVTIIGGHAFSGCLSLTSITIPNSITSIGNSAFGYCSSLTSVTIPNSVTSIGGYAFRNCSALTSIIIPNSITSIGSHAFNYCSSLTSITIPNSVTSIEDGAFADCSSLTSMTVENGNTVYDSRENCNAIIETATNTLIAGCQNTIIPNSVTSIGNFAFEGCSSLTSVTIPNSVTSIGDWAFHCCRNLSSVIIPNSVTSIGDYAFSSCSSLTSITIPNSVMSIGTSAFSGCSSLTSVTIPESLTSIGDYAFSSCSSLTSITIPNSVMSIGTSAFSGCSSLTSVTIPESLTSIGRWAFNCSSLDTIRVEAITPPTLRVDAFTSSPLCNIPCGTLAAYQASDWASQVSEFVEDCVEGQQIYYTSTDGNIVTPNINAFDANIVSNIYENGVGTITFDGPITIVGDSAFISRSKLSSITIPDGVISIGNHAFAGCSSLVSITISNTVTSIGDFAFRNCSSLQSITIPNSVINIGEDAFWHTGIYDDEANWLNNVLYIDNCLIEAKGLSGTYAILENTRVIAEMACYSLYDLTSITIPNSVTSIGDHAFMHTPIRTVIIPRSLTNIGRVVFTELDTIIVEKGNSRYDSRDNCNAIIETATNTLIAGCEKTIIPNSVTRIGEWAFAFYSLHNLVIPNSITSIGDYAFWRCYCYNYDNNNNIVIPSSVTHIGDSAFRWLSDNFTNHIYVKSPTPPTIGKEAFNSSSKCYIPCNSSTAYQRSDWNTYFSEFVEVGCDLNSQITYTSTDGCIVRPHAYNVFGANIVSNTYENGVGTITFDAPITSIGEEAFQYCSSLTSITIPNSVMNIGSYAFHECTSLTFISIPNSVTNIGESAFNNCTSLTSITIPDSMISIGDWAFYNSQLETIYVDAIIPPTIGVGAVTTSPICYIPCGALAAYAASKWLTEMDELIEEEGCRKCGDNLYWEYIESTHTLIFTGHGNMYDYNSRRPWDKLCDSIQNVSIPEGVTSIGNYAFYLCHNLSSITIPNSVTSIGSYAFYDCESLNLISLGNTLTHIGKSAFYRCAFSSITLPERLTSIGEGAFYMCDSLVTINIPDGITSIENRTFCSCESLASIKIPDNVVSIGEQAFYFCESLTSVNIPNNVTNIGDGAFDHCSTIDSIFVPKSVTQIGEWAFRDMRSLISIVVEDGNTTYDSRENCNAIIETASNTLIFGCKKTIIPNTIVQIGSHAFESSASGISLLVIPNSVQYIGEYAFNCLNMWKITVEAIHPPVLADNVFAPNHSNYLKCIIPCGTLDAYQSSAWANQVGSFEEECVEGQKIYYTSTDGNIVTPYAIDVFGANIVSNTYENGVGTIAFDGPVTTIGYQAFNDCYSLTSITIPNSVTGIGNSAFSSCTSLTSITIPNSVTSIGTGVFSNCYFLASVIIPNSVTSIEAGVFYRCSSLTYVTIPNSVTSIGERAFAYCSSLDTIHVEAITPPTLESNVFIESPVSICYIPCGTLAAYASSDWVSQVSEFVEACVEGQQIYYISTDGNIITPYRTDDFGANIVSNTYENGVGIITFDAPVTSVAFSSCSTLTSIIIPNSVTSIGSSAFQNCSSLTSINIPSSIMFITEYALAGCSSLTSIVVESGNTSYDSRNNCNAIIETSTNTLIAGCQNTIIPNNVTSIGTAAFRGCSAMVDITIPNSITTIGWGAFGYCSSLTSITIPNSVTSILNFAFHDCSSLDTIRIEATTPPTLGENVFALTPSPVCVIPCGSLAAYEASAWASQVGEFVEEGCAPIQMCGDDLYWEYADGVLTITGTGDMYDYADDKTGPAPWYDVRGSITTINMPNEMTKIGDYAFYKCTEVTSINMPTTLTAIGEKAFAQDTKLACDIILPASMTTIASRAFFNCQAVTAFHLEATTPPTIPNDAFERTTASIHVPCGYGHIYGKHTQWGMLNLEMCELLQDNVYYYPIDGHTARAVTYHSNPTDTLVIPSAVVIGGMPRTVTEVADSAFADCKDIPAIIFNEGLEYIGERAFVRCYGLHGTIVLPATLETIGERAFSYCDNVEKYLIQAMTPPALGANAFTGNNKNALFYISCEAMDDYKVATNWSSLKSRLRDACLNIYHYNTALGANGVHTTEDTLVASIYYRRQFTPYRWETLYLPFEVDRVTVLEDGEEFDLRPWNIITGGDYYLAKPDGMLNLDILFDFTDELEAHTPYIIQFVYDYYRDKIITFYGKESWNKLSTSFEVLSSSAWMQIAGNTTLQDQLLEKPVYMLRSGLDFILQKTTTTLHPFECYVMPYATPSGTPARMNVRFRGDVPTAVESVMGNESHLTYTVDGYTLTVYPQGQAFSIYSLNGALIYSCEAGKEAVDCELNSGCYLLHAGAEAHKIML